MLRLRTTVVAFAARRARLLSTNPSVDDNAFVRSISAQQAEKALARGAAIRAEHVAAKSDGAFPAASQGERRVDADEANRKRVTYRSKQRGWLEVDLLLGRWASQNVMQLSRDELQQYEDILNEETIDIFNYISGKSQVPARLDTPMMKRLQDFCLTSPLGKASLEGFAQNKKFMSN
ncbi:hypothetical protein PF005_g9852 [Phytophthora fragariae]|uniref:Succinate dehydrogenase assembly factor 2, mitochondrial n=1 Tax=Phytophthora fragariae TaxID=53985 RepID=A0A6A3ZJU5_9STRA|nr:hypothetical protein PF003_g27758 [Phytophthora fragariae]KAE8939983.1 hypothetical protein PF009_g10199 [Phytophthora fragariae]KAE9004870.1 hypothetical protein PF011_g12282 [Phytophthora fragariae]KAE9110162.1 hypothetical protein PF010_g11267 [Phytophthora fragariae]KAE9115630.1 hypothetical protein PF007_g9956 [Phytophthora fragariae]